MNSIRTQLVSIFCAAGITVNAQESDPEKKRSYNLFNPVPKSEMRIFSIDRPDVTESPMTVDAGHFQFEGDLFKFIKPQQGKSERAYNIVNGLYKMGLSDSWDIHIGIEMYNLYQDAEGNTVEKGYGNTTIRLKYNFWGNDGGTRTALGAIPYVTLPTSPVDEDVAFGIGFPFSYGINDSYSAGAQFQFDFVPDGTGNYSMSYLQTIVLGGPLAANLDFYIEGVGIFSKDATILTANGGLIYNVTPNVKIDVATNLGLVDDAPTRAYVGLSFRI
ncbi:MAG: transporter [Cyclobacteriaceae bacterium]